MSSRIFGTPENTGFEPPMVPSLKDAQYRFLVLQNQKTAQTLQLGKWLEEHHSVLTPLQTAMAVAPELSNADAVAVWKVYKDDPLQRQQAQDFLIESNLRLVRMFVARFVKDNSKRDDCFNAGIIGMIQAIEKFDPEKSSLSHHMSFGIIGRIIEELKKSKSLINVSLDRQKEIKRMREVEIELYQELNDPERKEPFSPHIRTKTNSWPAQWQIAERLFEKYGIGNTRKEYVIDLQVDEMMLHLASLNAEPQNNSDAPSDTHEELQEPEDTTTDVVADATRRLLRQTLGEVLEDKIPPQKRSILKMRWGLGEEDLDETKETDIAKALGIKKDRARELLEQVMSTLRGTPDIKAFKEYLG